MRGEPPATDARPLDQISLNLCKNARDPHHEISRLSARRLVQRLQNLGFAVQLTPRGGRPVEIHAYADRVVIRQDGRIVAEHPRRCGRGETIYDPWHYVPVLARKPGALRNGAPFKDWVLPTALDRVRRKLAGSDDGDRQMVKILAAVLTDGLLAVEAACLQALSEGVHSADVVINILARQRDPGPAATIMTPDGIVTALWACGVLSDRVAQRG